MNAYPCCEALRMPINTDKFHPRISAGVTIIFVFIVEKFLRFRNNPKIANAIITIMSCHHILKALQPRRTMTLQK